MSLRLEAAIKGNLGQIMAQELADATRGVSAAVEEATDRLKESLRDQVRKAGMGDRLANTWRGSFYPNKGLDAAGIVWSKATGIITAHDVGITIRAKNGTYLAVPTEAGRNVGRRGRYHKISPKEIAHLPLRLIERRNGPSLLVLDEARITKKGRVKQATRTKTGKLRSGTVGVVLFILVKQTTLRKVLDVKGAIFSVYRDLPVIIQKHYRATSRLRNSEGDLE